MRAKETVENELVSTLNQLREAEIALEDARIKAACFWSNGTQDGKIPTESKSAAWRSENAKNYQPLDGLYAEIYRLGNCARKLANELKVLSLWTCRLKDGTEIRVWLDDAYWTKEE